MIPLKQQDQPRDTKMTNLASITIPAYKMDQLSTAIDKINRKANKINNGGISIVSCDTYYKTITDDNGNNVKVQFANLVIAGTIPNVAGWKIAAIIDHSNELDLVHAYSEIPESYRDRGSFCDHCNTMRKRNKTIILVNENNEYKQVGSTCLNDFTNQSTNGVLGYLESINDLIDHYGDDNTDIDPVYYTYPIESVIAAAINIIHNYGFTKSSDENYSTGIISTKSRMIDYFTSNNSILQEQYNNLINVPDIDNVVSNVISWINNNTSKTEFIINLQSMMQFTGLKPNHFGYIAGAVVSYNKSVSDTIKNKITYNNEYVGNIKDRMIFTVKLLNIHSIDGYYGTTFIHIFIDDKNHNIIWFASKDCGYNVGDQFNMKATIKDHKEYKGIKQTVINRPTF